MGRVPPGAPSASAARSGCLRSERRDEGGEGARQTSRHTQTQTQPRLFDSNVMVNCTELHRL